MGRCSAVYEIAGSMFHRMRTMKVDAEELRRMYEQDEMSTQAISLATGVPHTTVYNRLVRLGVKMRSQGTIRDLEGSRMGHYEVGSFSHTEDGTAYWHCLCVCGKQVVESARRLVYVKKPHCGCQKNSRHRGYGDILGTYWWFVVHGAKIRDLEITVTIEDAWQQFLDQGGICALSGVSICLARTAKEWVQRLQTASFDRKNSDLGYVPGNTQWVHKDVNCLKNNFPEDELFFWAKRIYEHNKLGAAA